MKRQQPLDQSMGLADDSIRIESLRQSPLRPKGESAALTQGQLRPALKQRIWNADRGPNCGCNNTMKRARSPRHLGYKELFELEEYKMKYALRSAFVIAFALLAGVSALKAADGCISYGDEKTDFTWRLCPAGEKYERQYLYFGFWSSFYRVPEDSGACRWWATKSTWVCPGRVIHCDARRCSAN
jgi:hypothetical protein